MKCSQRKVKNEQKLIKDDSKRIKKWRKDYQNKRSDVNPDSPDFMKEIKFPEMCLYNIHGKNGRKNLKTIIEIDGDLNKTIGPLETTKKYNTNLKKNNALLQKKRGLSQYVEVEPRTSGRHGTEIRKEKAINLKESKKINSTLQKRIKKILDRNKKKTR